MKKIIFIISFLTFFLLYSSLTEFYTLQSPYLISSDPIVLTTFPSSNLEYELFKSNLSFDFLNGGIFSYGFFENKTGRVGVGVEVFSDSIENEFITTIFDKSIKPVKFSGYFAKNFNRINAGISFKFFSINESYTDEESPFSNTKKELSSYELSPSFTIDFSENLKFDLSPEISILNVSSENLSNSVKSENPFGFGLKFRMKQYFYENFIGILFNFKSKSYAYQIIESGNFKGDIYNNGVDTLSVLFFVGLESFNYHSSYITGEYKKISYLNLIKYETGVEVISIDEINIFPKITIGTNFYLTNHFDLNVGFSGSYVVKNQKYPERLNPIVKTAYFDYDGRLGIMFKVENLKISLDFSKNLVNIPFIISGKTVDNISVNFGLSYFGYEY